MKKIDMVKRAFLLVSLVLLQGSCFAVESLNINLGRDYLITNSKPMNSTIVKNPNIVTVTPFFTIFNEKNVLMLHPEKIGKTEFTIFMNDGDYIFSVTVSPKCPDKEVKAVKKGEFEVTELDKPPIIEDEFELDEPPSKLGE